MVNNSGNYVHGSSYDFRFQIGLPDKDLKAKSENSSIQKMGSGGSFCTNPEALSRKIGHLFWLRVHPTHTKNPFSDDRVYLTIENNKLELTEERSKRISVSKITEIIKNTLEQPMSDDLKIPILRDYQSIMFRYEQKHTSWYATLFNFLFLSKKSKIKQETEFKNNMNAASELLHREMSQIKKLLGNEEKEIYSKLLKKIEEVEGKLISSGQKMDTNIQKRMNAKYKKGNFGTCAYGLPSLLEDKGDELNEIGKEIRALSSQLFENFQSHYHWIRVINSEVAEDVGL